jgi:hypothetical protein
MYDQMSKMQILKIFKEEGKYRRKRNDAAIFVFVVFAVNEMISQYTRIPSKKFLCYFLLENVFNQATKDPEIFPEYESSGTSN